MVIFKSLRQYTHLVNGIRFPQKNTNPFLLVYFSENSLLIDDYPKLGIKSIDARYVVSPITKVPRTWLAPDTKKLFKTYGLYAYTDRQKMPTGQNLFYDMTKYLRAVETTYKVTNYRQRAGFLIMNLLREAFDKYPSHYQKILMYSVNASKDLSALLNRKIFPLLKQIKDGDLMFDHMVLSIVGETGTKHRLLIKDRVYQFTRIYQILKSIKLDQADEDIVEDTQAAAVEIIQKIESDIKPSNKAAIKGAIEDFLVQSSSSLEKLTSKAASTEDMKRIAMAAILSKTNGDIPKSIGLVQSIPVKNIQKAIRAIDKNYADEMLEPIKPVSSTDDILVEAANTPKAVDNKTPEHIFQKRQVDFQKNLRKDLESSFKVLEKKDQPLFVKKVEIVPKKQPKGELNKSDLEIAKITLQDKNGNSHVVQIDIPKIDPNTGTFRVYGKKKCLINQVILCPITFPAPYESRFEGSYSKFRIHSKRTVRLKYLEGYIGSYKLPLSVVLFYSFGFEQILKDYKLKYEYTEDKPKKTDKFIYKINDKKYIRFLNVDTELKDEFCESVGKIGLVKYADTIKFEFGTKEYFDALIKEMTGRVNSTWLLNNMLENIVDPVAKQVLINKQLPHELKDIMYYMASKVVEGFSQARNDLSNQRVRGSETIVHLVHKQLQAAHTDYREQKLAGNDKAEFKMNQSKVMMDFNQLEIVQDMEYSNPIEEMATMTRISPVGKTVGGIPDKQAIQTQARSVHNSYFGNVDPLDTPEGGNIGIVQHLTVNAFVTSARGLILQKEISDKEGSGVLSTTTCLTPFVENNDGARVIMLSAQQQQCVPLKNPEPPVVQSGYESLLTNVLSENFVKKASCNGKVIEVTPDQITIQCTKGGKQTIPTIPVHLRSGSGKDTLSVFQHKVKVGQSTKSNQIISEGSCVSNGSIALGRTLLTAVMPYKGYNFEDSVVISDKLAKEDTLTSLHGIFEEVIISDKDRLLFICEIGQKIERGNPILRKTMGELEELLGIDEDEESIDYAGGQMIKKSPGGTIVDIEVFSNVADDKFPELTKLIRRTRKFHGLTAKDKITVRGTPIKGVLVRFKIEQEMRIGVGDKLTNRYGAKGTIGLIEKDELMPRTPWGERIEYIMNPIGIIGRMNVGQLLELYTGLISRDLASRALQMKTKAQVLTLLRQVYPKLDGSNKQEFSGEFLKNFAKLSDTKFKMFMKQIQNTNFVPVIIPPFKAPTHQSIHQVLKLLKLKTGYYLNLPEYNTKTKKPVPVGYMYMNKLEHISEEKTHSRSTGPVTGKTKQPTSGKRREGGQRLGEMDTYAFISYNCTTLLSELMGPLSDDHVTKNEIISDIVQKGKAEFRVPKTSPARDLLSSYMTALCLTR